MADVPNPADSQPPRISLVIPAYNEAQYLPRLLESVAVARKNYCQGAECVEVIVADNDSTDRTAAIATEYGCHVKHVEQRRIASARNGGAAEARGDIVAFADADFRLHPETFNYIESVMLHGGFVGGATGLVMERWSLGIACTWYLIMPPLWLLGMDGGVWFCRRADFLEIGGYDESWAMGEDVDFLSRLKRLGSHRRPKQRLATRFASRRLGLNPALAVNSCRKWDKHGEWHMFTDSARAACYFIFARRKAEEMVRQYWYEDRAGGDG